MNNNIGLVDRVINLQQGRNKTIIVNRTLHTLIKVESSRRQQSMEAYIRDLVYKDQNIPQ